MSMTIQQAVKAWERSYSYLTGLGDRAIPVNKDFVRITLEALREKAEREDPKPLTFKELRQMEGEPVWLHTITDPRSYRCGLIFVQVAEIRTARYCAFWAFGDECEIDRNPDEYGKTWICYRYKPKEV